MDVEPSLPDIGDADYLVKLMDELGGAINNGMALVPVSWTEINAWLNVTKLSLSTWEILTLKAMSAAYSYTLNDASEPNASAPYTPEKPVEDLDSKIMFILNSFSNSAKINEE